MIQPGQRIREYELEVPLGEGAMGQVWRGRHVFLGQIRALKILDPLAGANPDRVARFVAEGQSMAAFQHPRILNAVDFFQDGPLYVLVLPYMGGGTLADRIDANPHGMPLLEVQRILMPMLRALDHAHQNGVIHRDVKPANILFDDEDEPFLSDFGIAKRLGVDQGTKTKMTIGTPAYMAPEQIVTPQSIDGRADQYALGCVAYEMLTGQLLFGEHVTSDYALQTAHVKEPPPPPRGLRKDLPEAWEAVVLKALEKARENRWEDCGAMADALDLAPQATRVPPPAPPMATKVEPLSVTPPPSKTATTPKPDPVKPASVKPAPSHKPTVALIGGLLVLVLVGSVWAMSQKKSHPPNQLREQGLEAFARQDYPKAKVLLQQAAEAGDAAAMTSLGLMFKDGQGDPKDINQALVWLKKAAEAKHGQAFYALGSLYWSGDPDLPKNRVEAVGWLKQAVEAKHFLYACNLLGRAYRDGDGVEQDSASAQKWFAEGAKISPDEADRKACASALAALLGLPEIELVKVPAGSFQMGSPETEEGRQDVEGPQHQVKISRDFWLGKYPVTQGQWELVMGSNPSRFKGDPNRPVERVHWVDVQGFIEKLNQIQKEWVYRLPTEAEWEYACRAGTAGNTYGPLDAIAWYEQNSKQGTHPVGQKTPNTFGLYDMIGNVAQWCQDEMIPYSPEAQIDPSGKMGGLQRAARGGSWGVPPQECRAAARDEPKVDNRSETLGFRLAGQPASIP